MNSLAVRVSSIKSGENVKKISEIRVSLLGLPPTPIFFTKLPNADGNMFFEYFKSEYLAASGVDYQLTALKQIIEKFKQDKPSQLSIEQLCKILTDIFFYAPLKHPIRNTIVKVLHQATDEKREKVIKAMLDTIAESDEAVSNSLIKFHANIESINYFVTSLIGCFENFAEAVKAIESYFVQLLRTLNKVISHYMDILGSALDLSPGKRSEIYIFLHNAIRVVLSCAQQFVSNTTDREILDRLLAQCWFELIDNIDYADLPMDTKVNCGILKVCYDRSFGNIYGPRENIFTNLHLNRSAEMAENAKIVKELCYAVAIINTITEMDFHNKDFCTALKTVVERLINVGKEHTMDSGMIMAVTRALVQMSKKLLILLRKSLNEIEPNDENVLKDITELCLKYVWLNVDHSIDCVRYLVKDLLKNLLRLGNQHEKQFIGLINETISIAKSSESNEELVCLLLDHLCQVLTTERVLAEVTDIQKRILAKIFLDSCWSTCYERLMVTNGTEIELTIWCKRWIDPLLNVSESEWKDNFDRLKIIRNLFERALKTKPEAAEYILEQREISLEIYLFVLWTMRRSGRKNYSPKNWKPSSDPKIVYAKIHPCDEMRILAFRILIECHKTSEYFPLSDLREILEFFRFNCNCQNPSIRQQINTTMKRALTRIECGYLAVAKNQTSENLEVHTYYEKFMRDLIVFCVESCLFDGANFSRRTIGLTTLLHSIETWQILLPQDRTIYTIRLRNRLRKTLSDSYVSNKELATNILRLCVNYFDKAESIFYDLNQTAKLIRSIRPDDSTTAAYYLEYCGFSHTHFQRHYDAVVWCEKILDDGLATACVSLLKAARYNPLYGSLLCIRHILLQIDFMKITNRYEIDEWRTFFVRIIPKCKQLTDVVAPIVNSSAPEGHLPNDLNDISNYIPNGDETESNSQIKVTPQIMLICAWRTVREVALLLGDIALRTPVIATDNSKSLSANGLITIEELLQIGVHFQQLLAETKHRGAFEQAFVGFSKLCVRLWRSNEPQLHCCPMKWIKKIASIISGEVPIDENSTELDVTKLCATRRSAGIPFMVQALVTSEVQVCSTKALTFCMTTFIEISRNGLRAESRTHSLNILRALFRCTELGEAVSEYVSDGIECSIRGYSASIWPERNSSTLLFSSLITRIFGVQRTKESENLNIKNKMTGRIFFIRYPRLYDFFLSELKTASEAIKYNERPSRLHPLLLVISRLYPSALEGCESNLKLSTFIPFISGCSSSPELVTRQLSAKSMVALISAPNTADRMFFILDELKVSNLSANAIHGFLLQILYLIRATKQNLFQIDNVKLIKFTTLFLKLDLEYNSITAKVFLEILIEILINCNLRDIDDSLHQQLYHTRDQIHEKLVHPNQYNGLTQSYVQKTFTVFSLILSSGCRQFNVNRNIPFVHNTVVHTHNELLETQLNVWHLIMLKLNHLEYSIQDFTKIEIDLVDYLHTNLNGEYEHVYKLLPSTCDLYYIINNRNLFYPFGTIKAFHILSILLKTYPLNEFKKATLDELLQLMDSASNDMEIDEVCVAIWKYTNEQLNRECVNVQKIDSEKMENILTHIRHISLPYKSCELRQIATETISIISPYFLMDPPDCTILINFTELLLTLLQDDNILVRNSASEIVVKFTNVKNELIKKVIPLVAQDYLLDWIDDVFQSVCSKNCWSLWLDLIKMIQSTIRESVKHLDDGKDDVNCAEIDVDIFEANEVNMFGETNYVIYKCYNFLMLQIETSDDISLDEKITIRKQIHAEFPTLHHF